MNIGTKFISLQARIGGLISNDNNLRIPIAPKRTFKSSLVFNRFRSYSKSVSYKNYNHLSYLKLHLLDIFYKLVGAYFPDKWKCIFNSNINKRHVSLRGLKTMKSRWNWLLAKCFWIWSTIFLNHILALSFKVLLSKMYLACF